MTWLIVIPSVAYWLAAARYAGRRWWSGDYMDDGFDLFMVTCAALFFGWLAAPILLFFALLKADGSPADVARLLFGESRHVKAARREAALRDREREVARAECELKIGPYA